MSELFSGSRRSTSPPCLCVAGWWAAPGWPACWLWPGTWLTGERNSATVFLVLRCEVSLKASSCFFLLSKSDQHSKVTFLLGTLSCILSLHFSCCGFYFLITTQAWNTGHFRLLLRQIKIPCSLVFFLFYGDLSTLQHFCGSFLPQTRYNQSGLCYSSAGQLGSALLLLPGCSFDWILK